MKGTIIFDFDGVLADSFGPLFRLNRDAMRSLGRTLSERGYRDLFMDNIHKALERKLGAADLKRLKAFKKARFERYYLKSRLFPFAGALVRELGPRYRMGIVSSTAARLIRALLKKERLDRKFALVYGALGTSKETEVRRAVRRIGRGSFKDAFFVSDTTGDLKLGKRLGMRTLGVRWGFHPERELRKTRPSGFCAHPRQLRGYLLNGKRKKP